MDFLYRVGGVTKVKDNLTVQFRNEKGVIEFTPAALRVTSKLKLDTCIFGEDFAFLKSVAKATPKLSAIIWAVLAMLLAMLASWSLMSA